MTPYLFFNKNSDVMFNRNLIEVEYEPVNEVVEVYKICVASHTFALLRDNVGKLVKDKIDAIIRMDEKIKNLDTANKEDSSTNPIKKSELEMLTPEDILRKIKKKDNQRLN